MSDTLIGKEVGSYRIIDTLGQGGVGSVYLARHPAIGKKIAIKFLKQELSHHPTIAARFLREAKAVNDIHHENVVDVLDFGQTADGECYILMEYLEGVPLSESLKEAPFPNRRIGHLGLQICSALHASHEKGIVHRDLKPPNIFLTIRSGRPDFVKVLDFGIAKLLNDDPSAAIRTHAGTMVGTPLYLSPEQALGEEIDPLADIYSLGIILYQMATGTLPFYDQNPVVLAGMHVSAPVPPPRDRYAQITGDLEALVVRCLAKHKEERFPSMLDLAEALGPACGLDPSPYFPQSALTQPVPYRINSPSAAELYPQTLQDGEAKILPPDETLLPRVSMPTHLGARRSKGSPLLWIGGGAVSGAVLAGWLYTSFMSVAPPAEAAPPATPVKPATQVSAPLATPNGGPTVAAPELTKEKTPEEDGAKSAPKKSSPTRTTKVEKTPERAVTPPPDKKKDEKKRAGDFTVDPFD